VFFLFIDFFFVIALNFHNTFCRALFTCWLITSVVKLKVLFLDGPRAPDIFVVNPGLIFFPQNIYMFIMFMVDISN
jgi:hypothetical protein